MNQFGFPESDWKLYKSKIADWQEGYMEKLCKEYIDLLSSDRLSSDRFWELENRIREDKRATGVVVNNSRSNMIGNILICCMKVRSLSMTSAISARSCGRG